MTEEERFLQTISFAHLPLHLLIVPALTISSGSATVGHPHKKAAEKNYHHSHHDTKGEFLSVQAASPAWEFLGEPGLPKVDWPADYDTRAIGPRLGYVRRDQKHGLSAIDWTWMLDFADRQWER